MTLKREFLVAYGSHTGQAETIAKQLVERAERIGLKPRLHVLDDNEKSFALEKEPLVVIVVSSTGDGDPPENCARFVRRLARKTLPQEFLKNVTFALLGLGDSNYSTFQGVPSKIDRLMVEHGAKRLIDTGKADDQVGLELIVEPWCEQLFQALIKWFELPQEALTTLESKLSLQPVKSEEEKKAIAEKRKEDNREEEDGEEENEEDRKHTNHKRLRLEPFVYEVGNSIRSGAPELRADEGLRVPVASQPFLVSSVSHRAAPQDIPWQNDAPVIGTEPGLKRATVVGTALLTAPTAGKPKYELTIEFQDETFTPTHEPGDTYYFCAPNPREEIDFILERMGLLAVADRECRVEVDPKTQKKAATVPSHLPPVSSLRFLFTHCVDIRRAPGRPVLRWLADAADDEAEKRRLLELCSVQGVNEFSTLLRVPNVSLIDLLAAFPSVRPSADRLLELLPRLAARPYSAASSAQQVGERRRRVRFCYSLMHFPPTEGRRYSRAGLASQWMTNLKLGDEITVLVGKPTRFRVPMEGPHRPLIFIGPGTGLAPFLAALQAFGQKKSNGAQRLLLFGCRDRNLDYMYREELEARKALGVLSELVICESVGGGEEEVEAESRFEKGYVQEGLKRRAAFVKEFLDKEHSMVFVCGDAKGMSKDVWATFISILVEGGMSETEAKTFMEGLKKAERYLEDVWS